MRTSRAATSARRPAETGDGWLHTGDLGAIGDDGQVFIRGRKKDVIVPADGTKVFPEDVERVVQGSPASATSARSA